MLRRILGTFTVMALLLSAGSALAQEKTKFYNFDDMLIDGQLKTPDLQRADARDKAKFARLLKLKKSFMPKVRETAEAKSLQ
jgi:hypothetical protein